MGAAALSYSILVERKALRQLQRIPPPHRQRVRGAVLDLAENPRPSNARKLTGRPAWRVRIGDYRVIYEIDDANTTVLVVVIGPRGDVYRR